MQTKFWLLIVVALAPLGMNAASAKPMPPATLEEAAQSPFVAVVEYVSYDKNQKIGYFNGCTAEYRVLKILKGDKLPQTIMVRYLFHDLSPCLEPVGWKFTEDKLPKAGSKWILFLKPGEKATDPCDTYRGDAGRLEPTAGNLKKVNDLLKK